MRSTSTLTWEYLLTVLSVKRSTEQDCRTRPGSILRLMEIKITKEYNRRWLGKNWSRLYTQTMKAVKQMICSDHITETKDRTPRNKILTPDTETTRREKRTEEQTPTPKQAPPPSARTASSTRRASARILSTPASLQPESAAPTQPRFGSSRLT